MIYVAFLIKKEMNVKKEIKIYVNFLKIKTVVKIMMNIDMFGGIEIIEILIIMKIKIILEIITIELKKKRKYKNNKIKIQFKLLKYLDYHQ